MDTSESPVISYEFFDPAMFAGAIRNAHLEACQLSEKPVPSRITRLQCPRLCLDLVSAGPAMLYEGEMPQGCYTLTFVVACPGTGQSFNFGTDFVDGYMGFFPPGGVLDATNPPGCVSAILTVPVEEVRAALAIYFPEIPNRILAEGIGMRVGLVEQARLRNLLKLIGLFIRERDEQTACKLSCSHLARVLLAAYLTALRSGCSAIVPRATTRVTRRHKRLRQARDFIEDHLHEPLHLDDLCSELDLSERGVENLFRDLTGLGPTAFLRHQRLHCAHRMLLHMDSAPGRVKEAALESGFWHFGHFSRNYCQLFGEKPSETLGRWGRG